MITTVTVINVFWIYRDKILKSFKFQRKSKGNESE